MRLELQLNIATSMKPPPLSREITHNVTSLEYHVTVAQPALILRRVGRQVGEHNSLPKRSRATRVGRIHSVTARGPKARKWPAPRPSAALPETAQARRAKKKATGTQTQLFIALPLQSGVLGKMSPRKLFATRSGSGKADMAVGYQEHLSPSGR
jgi:hypothetical protein